MTGDRAQASGQMRKRGHQWRLYLNQREWWAPKGRGPVRITEMDPEHRKNAAAWLLRRAPAIELYYTLAELERLFAPMPVVIGERGGQPVERLDPEACMWPSEGSMAADALTAEFERRALDPEAWLRATPLYKALAGES